MEIVASWDSCFADNPAWGFNMKVPNPIILCIVFVRNQLHKLRFVEYRPGTYFLLLGTKIQMSQPSGSDELRKLDLGPKHCREIRESGRGGRNFANWYRVRPPCNIMNF